MKKRGFIFISIVFILTMLSCNRTYNINFEDVIEISIDSENEIVKKDASNFLTINIKNNNNKKVKISKASYFLEFTAEPFGNTHILNLDVIDDKNQNDWLPNEKMRFEAKKTFSKKIDMEKVLWKSFKNSENILADGDYWVRLILEAESENGDKIYSKSIKSNLLGIKIVNKI